MSTEGKMKTHSKSSSCSINNNNNNNNEDVINNIGVESDGSRDKLNSIFSACLLKHVEAMCNQSKALLLQSETLQCLSFSNSKREKMKLTTNSFTSTNVIYCENNLNNCQSPMHTNDSIIPEKEPSYLNNILSDKKEELSDNLTDENVYNMKKNLLEPEGSNNLLSTNSHVICNDEFEGQNVTSEINSTEEKLTERHDDELIDQNDEDNNYVVSPSLNNFRLKIYRRKRNYTEEMMKNAVNSVLFGKMSFTQAANVYKVPGRTLRDYVKEYEKKKNVF